ncbi:PQQ-binding-like beta-propeller repeat protein [Actinoplanes sp. NPDC051851]|uniref:outer membrane protein assembly factor BamB family protein n=1 Tax=Actinoplanes sp. NPDC051851 TaxID=3154753 RepID=UPI003436E03E
MTVIELGDVSGTGRDGPEPDPAGRPAPRSIRRRLAVAVALAGVLLLGAAAPPGVPLVHELWWAPFDDESSMTVRNGTVYVQKATTDGSVMTAYDLVTGDRRWKRATTGQASWMAVTGAGGVLLIAGAPVSTNVSYGDGSLAVQLSASELTALDEATGEPLWRAEGEMQAVSGDTVLLGDQDEAGHLTALRSIGLRTGSPRWERRITPAEVIATPDDGGDGPERIVTATADGRVTVFDAVDGTPLLARRVSWIERQPGEGLGTILRIAGDKLLVTRTDRRGGTITAYRLDTLDELWNTSANRQAVVQPCGPVLCLSNGGEVDGIDPATGALRWRGAGWAGAESLGGGRLLAYDNGQEPHQTLLDAATGRPIGAGDGVGYPIWPDAATGALLLVRALAEPGGRTVVTRLDLTTGRADPMGTVGTAEGINCRGTDRYLACQDDDRLIVTAVG